LLLYAYVGVGVEDQEGVVVGKPVVVRVEGSMMTVADKFRGEGSGDDGIERESISASAPAPSGVFRFGPER
jgi:hypothetical protein